MRMTVIKSRYYQCMCIIYSKYNIHDISVNFLLYVFIFKLDCIYTDVGKHYDGIRSYTATGHRCQRWDMQYPHKHNMTDPDMFPDADISSVRDYCRNPDGKPGIGPWCYTTDPGVQWESCSIPFCLGKYDINKA